MGPDAEFPRKTRKQKKEEKRIKKETKKAEKEAKRAEKEGRRQDMSSPNGLKSKSKDSNELDVV